MTIDKYAEAIRDARIAALVYDHHSLEASGGKPRQETNPFVQAQGYRDAVSFLWGRDSIARNRLGIWGDSMSANVTILAASMDERVKAVISLILGCGPVL